MSELARSILRTRRVGGHAGKEVELSGETTLEQCEFLAEQARRLDATTCLEVGLAYGISSLFLGEAIRHKAGAKLISIDPFQKDFFDDLGLTNLRRAGLGHLVDFYPEASHAVLPRLLAAGVKLDFAYVDTTKIFDVVLVDAYFLSRLLRVGGVMTFDDCLGWPGIRRVARCVAQWPHFEVAAVHGVKRPPLARRLASSAVGLVPWKNKLINDDLLKSPQQLGINARCVAFRKLREDDRPYSWYAPP